MRRMLELAYLAVALLMTLSPWIGGGDVPLPDDDIPSGEVSAAARDMILRYVANSADASDECVSRLQRGEITTQPEYAAFMEQAGSQAFQDAVENLAELQNNRLGTDDGQNSPFTVDAAIEFRSQVSDGLRSLLR